MSNLHPLFEEILSRFTRQTFIERVHEILDEPSVTTGTCQIPIEQGQEAYLCGKKAPTFCRDCMTEICSEHAYKCCMETYCGLCLSGHVCAIKGMC